LARYLVSWVPSLKAGRNLRPLCLQATWQEIVNLYRLTLPEEPSERLRGNPHAVPRPAVVGLVATDAKPSALNDIGVESGEVRVERIDDTSHLD
jgi:hypothetical protein